MLLRQLLHAKTFPGITASMQATHWYLRKFGWVPRPVRQVIVLVIGGTILLIGFVMVVTPGPAFLVIPVGLAILAFEFAWAARWLFKIRRAARNVMAYGTGPNVDEGRWPVRAAARCRRVASNGWRHCRVLLSRRTSLERL
jgi:uncharacterized protein (TIGR02611 family)